MEFGDSLSRTKNLEVALNITSDLHITKVLSLLAALVCFILCFISTILKHTVLEV